MATKSGVVKKLQNIGCLDFDISFGDSSLYSPIGKVWNATDGHVCVIHSDGNDFHGNIIRANEYWDFVLEDIELGMSPCLDIECEVCNE